MSELKFGSIVGIVPKNIFHCRIQSSKWIFYDNGIRNAIINNFRLLALRNDVGQLWENYLLAERIKKNAYDRKAVQYYFWRNYNQQEIDLIEIENGHPRFLQRYNAKSSDNKGLSSCWKVLIPIYFVKRNLSSEDNFHLYMQV